MFNLFFTRLDSSRLTLNQYRFDVVAAYVLNWDEFLTKMHEKGATPYL